MIEYRVAGPGDVEDVARLHAQSWRDSYRGAFTDEFLDGDLIGERLGVWRERLGDPPPDQLVVLACEGPKLLGFVCTYRGHDATWGSFVDNLHVAKAAKRTGIGATLMRRTGAWLAETHPDDGVYLLVLEMNAPARRFYERLGASHSGTELMESHGGAMVRSCRYTWARPALLAGDTT